MVYSSFPLLKLVISFAGKSLLSHEQITFSIMGWISKIFKGSSHNESEGQYDWGYGTNSVENYPSTSWVTIPANSGHVLVLFTYEPLHGCAILFSHSLLH